MTTNKRAARGYYVRLTTAPGEDEMAVFARNASEARRKALLLFVARGHDGVYAPRATFSALKAIRDDRI